MLSVRKGQASVEFLVIVAVGLLLAGIVGYFVISQKSVIGSRSEIDSAQLAVNDVVKAANDVFVQGAGSKKKVFITIPESVEIASSGLSEKTVFLSLYGTRVFSKANVQLAGEFPKQKGQQFVFVNARAEYVFVGESKVFLDKYSFFVSMQQGETATDALAIKNESSEVLSVSVGKDWNSSSVFLEVSPMAFSINPNESKNISLSFTARQFATGEEFGKISVKVSGSNYSESIQIPLTVSVRTAKTSTGGLKIIPSNWSVSLKPGDSASKVFKVCNELETPQGGIAFSKSELFSKELPKVEGGVVWSVFADNDFIYAGLQDGSILVWMPDLTFFKKISEASSPVHAVLSDGDFLYAGSSDGKLRVFSKQDFSLQKTLEASASILSMAADEEFIYAAASNGVVFVWEKQGFSLFKQFSSSAEPLASIAVDSENLYVGSSDGNVSIWKKQGFAFDRLLSQPSTSVNSIAVDSKFLLAGTQDGKVFVYNLNDFSLRTVISKGFSSVRQVFSKPSESYIAVAAADSGVYFFSWPDFFETFNSSAGTFMQSVFGSTSFALVGTDDSAIYAIKYGELVSKIAAYWLDGLDEISSIPSGSCVDKNITLTVPPLTASSTFFGIVEVGNGQGSDALQLQASVG